MASLPLFAWAISGNRPRPKDPFRRFHDTSAERDWVLRLRLGLLLGKDKFNGSPPLRMTMLFGLAGLAL